MLLIRGLAGGTGLTGTLYEPGEEAPSFKGAPEEGSPYVWVCDEFYAVETGGQPLQLDGGTVNVAFERPMPRGFGDRDAAIVAAQDHIRAQFVRIGIHETVEFEVEPSGE